MTNTEIGTPVGEDGIINTKRIYEKLSGVKTYLEDRLDVPLCLLADGHGPIAAELPWQEGPDGTVAAWRQLTLSAVRDGRVYFTNSVPSSAPVGTQLGGPGEGPARRVEAGGKESMEGQAFASLWSFGGRAMIEPPPPAQAAEE